MTAARTWVLVATLVCFAPVAHAAGISPAKRADIVKLLEMTGASSLGKQMATMVVAQMSQQMRQTNPNIPQRAIDVLPEEVAAVYDANIETFVEKVIPIYDKFFDESEIKGMIEFYSSKLGQKTISVMPQLLNESMLVGQAWAADLGPEIQKRIEARYKKEGIQP